MTKFTIAVGIIFVFISILFNALGSHALKQTLLERQAVDSFQIACNFTMYHGLALILLGLFMHVFPQINFIWVVGLILAGSVLFQGVIFLKSLTGVQGFGFLNPIGGMLLFLGWIYFLILVLRKIG